MCTGVKRRPPTLRKPDHTGVLIEMTLRNSSELQLLDLVLRVHREVGGPALPVRRIALRACGYVHRVAVQGDCSASCQCAAIQDRTGIHGDGRLRKNVAGKDGAGAKSGRATYLPEDVLRQATAN